MSVLRKKHFDDAAQKRFWSKVAIVWDETSCWLWLGAKHRDGHGKFRVGEAIEYAHRVAWAIVYGCTPYKRILCHSCNNPACVRPDHLYKGTHSDNAYDYWRQKQLDTAMMEQVA